MDSTYKQFVVPGGLTYPGKATSPLVYPGLNRVKVIWLRGSDPSVINARVFWNNYTDSVNVIIPPTGDTISVIIDNLPEKSYSFMIQTYDTKGHVSIPVEIMGESYGAKYQAQLLTRPVNSTILNTKGKITIQWGSADIANGAYATEVNYMDTLGNNKFQRFPTNLQSSIISDLKPGTKYQYRTVFKPDSISIDDFYTGYSESGDFSFDKKDWKIIDYSSQHSDGENAVINFIDGTDATRWHTNANTSTYPHFATIDMGVVRTITKFGVWITTYQTPGGDTRGPDKIQFLVSMDDINWTDLGIFDFNRFLISEQTYVMPSLPIGRYFKFVGVAGPNNYMVMGEISAYGF